MGQQMEYLVSSFKAGETASDQSCIEDLTKATNSMASRGFRLVSSVYDSRKMLTFLFFERNKSNEED